ncbi:hypothetical protein GYMLUDRAFT_251123 [Collybiopsis luxurians FD-317 M1]|uniref:Unplaced genomic scaffold GYMLUscaffold_93, whole genome shotgun sequence n=1 Tax=Collybiopsis luxurians FD-317 M1 TaxID=944289 RepID=A0A0D0CCC5_9AGAR|nr:hypothetical protein GYMLUDRAFT_251123 [Collybiopsis luxurians FD-317 M1]
MLTHHPAHQSYFKNQYASLNFDAAAAPIQAQASLHFSIPSVSSQACPSFPSIVIGNNGFDNNHAVDTLTSYSNPVLDETGADLLTISDRDSEVDLVEEDMDSIKKDLGLMHETDLTQLWADFPNLPDIPPGHEDGPSSSATRQLYDAPEEHVVNWNETARKVYNSQPEPNQHKHWQKLFAKNTHLADESYKLFLSCLDWEVLQWAVREKIIQGVFNCLLKIPQFGNTCQLKDQLGLLFSDSQSMFNFVDQIPNQCGPWFTKYLLFRDRPNEYFTVHHRNLVKAIQGIWGDPAFTNFLVYKPGKFFWDSDRSCDGQIFHKMWLGIMWIVTQDQLPAGATLAPVIIASDKMQLTYFTGGKAAYPACMLIAYLSVNKMAGSGHSKQTLKLQNYELFHCSMAEVLAPLKEVGHPTKGGVRMVGGNGETHLVWPILVAYVADYPKQCLVTCTKYGTCPKSHQKANDLGNTMRSKNHTSSWMLGIIKKAQSNGKSPSGVHSLAMEDNIAGRNYTPFWTDFPLCDIHNIITPNVLHQLYQGVFKHLISWVQAVMTEEGFDSQVLSLPPAFGVRHFKNGISGLSQWTSDTTLGSELEDVAVEVDDPAIVVNKNDDDEVVAAKGITQKKALELPLLFQSLDVWHQVKITLSSLFDNETVTEMVKAMPGWKGSTIG